MTNLEKYTNAFVDCLEVTAEQAVSLKYQDVQAWDSVGHMDLVATIEDLFDIMFETNDIIDFNSYEKGKEILEKNYGVEF